MFNLSAIFFLPQKKKQHTIETTKAICMEILAGKISSYLILYHRQSFRETGFSSKDTYHSPETKL